MNGYDYSSESLQSIIFLPTTNKLNHLLLSGLFRFKLKRILSCLSYDWTYNIVGNNNFFVHRIFSVSDRHHHHWEMCESPLDFTSDEGSSVCSPVQFTMSSSDDNEQLMMAQLCELLPGIACCYLCLFAIV